VFDQTPADELLVLIAAVLLACEIYALGMVRSLRRHIDGGSGDYLLRIVFRFGCFVTLAQTFTVVNSILRWSDRMGTYDARLLILLVGEMFISVAFFWTVWEIHRLPADRYGQHSPVSRPEQPKCLCKEIHDTVAGTGAGVDQGDPDAAVTPD
jgi:hypothetical protein